MSRLAHVLCKRGARVFEQAWNCIRPLAVHIIGPGTLDRSQAGLASGSESTVSSWLLRVFVSSAQRVPRSWTGSRDQVSTVCTWTAVTLSKTEVHSAGVNSSVLDMSQRSKRPGLRGYPPTQLPSYLVISHTHRTLLCRHTIFAFAAQIRSPCFFVPRPNYLFAVLLQLPVRALP